MYPYVGSSSELDLHQETGAKALITFCIPRVMYSMGVQRPASTQSKNNAAIQIPMKDYIKFHDGTVWPFYKYQ